jgi:hypothetical protein
LRRTEGARIRLVVAALAAPLVTTGGCSWILTQPRPDDWQNREHLDCSTNPAPPLIDSALALGYAGTTIYLAAFANGRGGALPIATGVVATTVWLSSAIYGFSKTNACRDALGENAHGYHPPAYGTGGEVFTPPPAPPKKPDAPSFGG